MGTERRARTVAAERCYASVYHDRKSKAFVEETAAALVVAVVAIGSNKRQWESQQWAHNGAWCLPLPPTMVTPIMIPFCPRFMLLFTMTMMLFMMMASVVVMAYRKAIRGPVVSRMNRHGLYWTLATSRHHNDNSYTSGAFGSAAPTDKLYWTAKRHVVSIHFSLPVSLFLTFYG